MTSTSPERTSSPELVQLFPWDNKGGYTTVLFPGIPTRVTRKVTRLGLLGSLDCSRFRNIDGIRALLTVVPVAVIILGMAFRFEPWMIFHWLIWGTVAHMVIDYTARFINRRRERRFLRNWESKTIVGPSDFELIISTLFEISERLLDEEGVASSLDPREHLSAPADTERQLMRLAALLTEAPTITPMELHALAEAIYQYRKTRSRGSVDFVVETWHRHRERNRRIGSGE